MTALAKSKGLLFMDATHFVHNPRTEVLRKYLAGGSYHTLLATFNAGPCASTDIRRNKELEPMVCSNTNVIVVVATF